MARLSGWVVLCLAAAAIGACGDDGNSSGTSAAAVDSGAVSDAKAAFEEFSKEPGPIELPAIDKPIPKADVTVLYPPTPGIDDIVGGVKAGAAELGWKVKESAPDVSPEAFASALDSIVEQRPDALIFLTPFPLDSYDKQLRKLQADGIPVVAVGATGYPVGGDSPVVASSGLDNVFGPLAELEAQTMISHAGGGPKMALVVDPSVPAWQTIIDNMRRTIEAAGGEYNQIDVALADLAKAPERVVSFLQSHPDVEYLWLTINAFNVGLPQALRSAGLADKVVTGTGAGDQSDVEGIENGSLYSTVAIETAGNGWRLVDATARALAGASLECCTKISSKYLIVTEGNLDLATDISAFPDQPDVFRKAWGLEG
jgi:ABC-type sugar transport system substrate-binding protein